MSLRISLSSAMDSWKRCRCEAAIMGEKDRNSMELELARRRRLQEMATEEGVIRFRTRSPFEGNGNEGHVMAHEVALRFPAWRMSLSLTEKMLCLGFWISEPFYSNGKNDLFPSIQNRGSNDG
jgi:hypothetical protein